MSGKAKRAIITVAGIDVEVFQLPTSEYRMSQSQAAKIVKKPRNSLLRFLAIRSRESFTDKRYECYEIPIEKDWKGRGNRQSVESISLDVAYEYVVLELQKHNPDALPFVIACGQETLHRRCDTAFEVVKTEAQYEQQTISAYDEYRQSREYLITIKFPATGSNREVTFGKQSLPEQ
ncbi:MAG: hypothetical protein V7L23_03080 [Nostoc sp.]|uniref:hypothetical protein n=1 Tax=Nostoc sp. TaxID=1180 RepID=UPI002FEE6D04